MFLRQPACRGPMWVETVCKDAISSREGTGHFFSTTIPLCLCIIHSFTWTWRGRRREDKVEMRVNGGEPFATIQTGDFFFPFLKIQCTKVTKIKLTVPSAAITLFLAEQERGINMSSYSAVHATYVQGAKLWVLREPWFWMSWLVSLNSQVQYSG